MNTITKANLRKAQATQRYLDFVTNIRNQLPTLGNKTVQSCEWTFIGSRSEGYITAPTGAEARYNRWNTINEICEIVASL